MAIKKLSYIELDKLTVELYNEFHKRNRNLYIEDCIEYFRKSRKYVEKHLHEIIYFSKNEEI